MKKEERLLDLIGRLPDEIIDEVYSDSMNFRGARKKKWKVFFHFKFYIPAACCICMLCLFVTFLYDTISNNTSLSSESSVPPTTVSVDDANAIIHQLDFDSSIYYVYDMSDKTFLASKGVNTESTKEVIGEHVAYLEEMDNLLFSSTETTDIELFSYAPASSKAVYIIKNKEDYYYAFLAFFKYDSNTNADSNSQKTEFSEIYATYGINAYNNIASLSYTIDSKNRVIKSEEAMNYFYSTCISLATFTKSEFMSDEYKDFPLDELGKIKTELEKSKIPITITTSDGLTLSIDYYPTCGWLYSDCALTYFKLSEPQKAWFEENINELK